MERILNALWIKYYTNTNVWTLSHISGVNCTDARDYSKLITDSVLTHIPPIIEHQLKHLYNKGHDWNCYFIGDPDNVKDVSNISNYVIITNKDYVAGIPTNIKQIKELKKWFNT